MTQPGLYEQVLGGTGAGVPPLRPPRPSAAVVPWRRRDGGRLEVFWVQRAESLPFMGGWHAFPGGGLSRADLAVRIEGLPEGLENPFAVTGLPEALTGAETPPDMVPGLLACAVRELFEEIGILLAREFLPGTGAGPVATVGELTEARRRLAAGETTLEEIATELQLTLDASPLVFAGRWLTPPFAPLRFDNRFFLFEWPPRWVFEPRLSGGELDHGEWLEPAAALDRWARGEVLAAPPILHLLRVLAEDGPEGGLPRLRNPREASLGPYRRIEFRPGVILLPLATATLPPATHTNAYLVGHGETVLVDPGSRDPVELEHLGGALRHLLQQPGRRFTAIWLTHHHPDHVGGVTVARELLGVPVLAHRATAERLREQGVPVDGTLEDGQEVTLAGEPPMTLRVIHTPGHARGHLCFYDADGGSLLAGDMVAGVGTIVIDPPEGDMDDYLASLERLADLEPKMLFPAHGPAIKDGGRKLREYRQHRLWREERILAAWQDGVREPREMLPRVYDDAPQAAWPLALRQVEAHLARLRRAGRIP